MTAEAIRNLVNAGFTVDEIAKRTINHNGGSIMGELSAPRNADMLKPADIVGHLLIVHPLEFVAEVATALGPKDAIRCDVVDLHQNNADGSYGVVFRDVLWFGRQLIPGLRRQIGELPFGWMSQGLGKPGQNPPYMLTDAMGDAASRAAAQSWLDRHPDFGSAPAATPAPAPQAPIQAPQAAPAPLAAPPVPNGTQAAPPVPQAAPQAIPAPLPASAPLAPPAGNGGSPLDQLDQAQRAALQALGFDLTGK